MYQNITADTMELFKKSLGLGTQETLRKGVTTSTGLTWYDLQVPAKNLYPIITPLRNATPRVHREKSGTATNWKQVTQLVGSGYDGMGWVPEGQRSGTMSYVTANKAASYVTIGEEDFLTFEAEAAAVGFEDENALVTMRLLQKMMRKEESAILSGNSGGIALGTPGTITTSSSGTGSTLPSATYYVKVAALTQEGYNNCQGNPVTGVPVSKTITGADGKQFVLNGGSSAISAEPSGQVVSLGAPLLATVPAIQGAVAYAWFVGTTSGGETLQVITTINSMSLGVPLVSGRQAQTALSSTDCSANANLAFDGLLTSALNSNNLGYVNILATGMAGVGTVLTSSGRGSVVEIDNMLQSMWQSYKISPTVIYVNAQEMKNITSKALNGASAPLLRYVAPDGKEYSLTAGGYIEWYYNPFDSNGGQKIPIRIHPDLAPGTILAYAEKLPTWYQSNEVPNVCEMVCRRDYYRMDWPLRTRQREYGIYAEEVLAIYATFAMGIITNIGNG